MLAVGLQLLGLVRLGPRPHARLVQHSLDEVRKLLLRPQVRNNRFWRVFAQRLLGGVAAQGPHVDQAAMVPLVDQHPRVFHFRSAAPSVVEDAEAVPLCLSQRLLPQLVERVGVVGILEAVVVLFLGQVGLRPVRGLQVLVVAGLAQIALHHVGQRQRATAQLRLRHDTNVVEDHIRPVSAVVEPAPLEACVEHRPRAGVGQQRRVVVKRRTAQMIEDVVTSRPADAGQPHVSLTGAQSSRLEIESVNLPRLSDSGDDLERLGMCSNKAVLTGSPSHSNLPSGLSRALLLSRSTKPPVWSPGAL